MLKQAAHGSFGVTLSKEVVIRDIVLKDTV